MINEEARENILAAVAKEKESAIKNHGYFHSDHEFWAVLKEEVEELQERSAYIASKFDLFWKAVRGDAVLNQDTLNIIRKNAINAACEAVQVTAVIDKYLEGESGRMILQKWNWDKREYEDCEIPDDWNCKVYSEDMDEIVNCAHCGKKIRFGDCYTSMEIHNKAGWGYAVCKDCYAEEWEKRRDESHKRRIMGDEEDVGSKTKEG